MAPGVAGFANIRYLSGIGIALPFKLHRRRVEGHAHLGAGGVGLDLRLNSGLFGLGMGRIVFAGEGRRAGLAVLAPVENGFVCVAGCRQNDPFIKIRYFFCARFVLKSFSTDGADIVTLLAILQASWRLAGYLYTVVRIDKHKGFFTCTGLYNAFCIDRLQHLASDGVSLFFCVVLNLEPQRDQFSVGGGIIERITRC